MSTDLILQNISRYVNLSPDEKAYFTSLLQSRSLKRKEFLLEDGQICKYSAFTLSGCLRGYTVDENGLEHVLSFAPQGWWMADMYSLISQKPGTLNIEAIEKTDILLLSKADQEKLYEQVPKFERFFRIITENSLVAYQQRLMDNLSLTAEERYLNFCKRYPTLIHTLPKKDIATYIGVTPEFLSRMLGKMLRNS
ncbi:Crp/Fnr family transcriptional regulator [Mucilaginibacter sp. KACC 22063]|uniref:Crp/Fnr family transcriptional regulator n=1 Tax=Mucilaginibacter sp. KACC 22063 TaxID=3025666 RepID=UPI00236535E5|nr:Crp/Fnr family transcriptional regulator [Mucilaginibacter sp. KACC 22063]WDF57040.1 Crp/Fnr family transcriptional regulator [Mucilaginibacter sp. KACC 22063]